MRSARPPALPVRPSASAPAAALPLPERPVRSARLLAAGLLLPPAAHPVRLHTGCTAQRHSWALSGSTPCPRSTPPAPHPRSRPVRLSVPPKGSFRSCRTRKPHSRSLRTAARPALHRSRIEARWSCGRQSRTVWPRRSAACPRRPGSPVQTSVPRGPPPSAGVPARLLRPLPPPRSAFQRHPLHCPPPRR